jgi:hypothetical protein
VLDGIGGRTRTRTWDPLIKSQLLYQLSYAPENAAPKGLGPVAKRVPTVQGRPEEIVGQSFPARPNTDEGIAAQGPSKIHLR